MTEKQKEKEKEKEFIYLFIYLFIICDSAWLPEFQQLWFKL